MLYENVDCSTTRYWFATPFLIKQPSHRSSFSSFPSKIFSAIQAVLDVVAVWNLLKKNNSLHQMTNVTLTLHIAGCMGGECGRLGQFLKEEVQSWAKGDPLAGEVPACGYEYRA